MESARERRDAALADLIARAEVGERQRRGPVYYNIEAPLGRCSNPRAGSAGVGRLVAGAAPSAANPVAPPQPEYTRLKPGGDPPTWIALPPPRHPRRPKPGPATGGRTDAAIDIGGSRSLPGVLRQEVLFGDTPFPGQTESLKKRPNPIRPH